MNTVLLAEELQTDDLKYLITIEDNFSKFLWATTANNKDAKSVELAIKTSFFFCGKPAILQTDNGKEFINTIVETYLEDQGVEFKHGRLYHPQSQGLIERANRTIQKALAQAYHKHKSNFNLQSNLIDIVDTYNDNVHTTLKVTPRTAFGLNSRGWDG